MKDDNRHHFRFKAKEVFERLIRKFGYETVRRLVPESHHKIINNIRKTTERAKRQKKAQADEDDDVNLQEEFTMKSMPERWVGRTFSFCLFPCSHIFLTFLGHLEKMT